MGLVETLLLSVSLAMDAFAVLLSSGTFVVVTSWRDYFRIPFHFGLFQFLMPVIGWYLGGTVALYIASFDHWVAFGLLVLIGLRMVLEANSHKSEKEKSDPSRGMSLVLLSVATSIDALAVGFGLALLKYPIWQPAALIGIITALLSFVGVTTGNRIGKKFGKWVEIIGGIILIFIGIKIALAHEAALRSTFPYFLKSLF